MKSTKRPIGIILSVLMIFQVFGFAFCAAAEGEETRTVSYVDAQGETRTVEAVVLTPRAAAYGAQDATGWYVIDGSYEGAQGVLFYDAVVNAILADGADWKITGTNNNFNCIYGSLNIYAQADGTGRLDLKDRITAYRGDVTIYGGNVTADGIQTEMSDHGKLTIRDGNIDAWGFYTKYLEISGGTVDGIPVSCSGKITISGGDYTADYTTAGGPSSVAINAPEIEITGGTVNAIGQMGIYSPSGSITITGGTVNVVANHVNAGMALSAPTVVITGGRVTATSERSFGLFSNGTVTLGADEPDTSIKFSSFYPDIAIEVKEGQTLTDGENDYTGALNAEQVAALAGKTLTCKHAFDGEWTYFDAEHHARFCASCGAAEYEAHDAIVRGAGEPTCGDEGFSGSEYCSVCGALLAEGEILPPSGDHVTELLNAKEATSTEDGYTGDLVCKICGQTVKTGKVIPATGEPDGPATPDEPESPEEPSGEQGKIHGEHCFCFDHPGDGLLGSIVKLCCAIYCFFLDLRAAIGV